MRRLHVPRLAAPGALDRRPGRDQRRQGLPQRRRLDLPALLRHDQGRRLPLARGQRLPARAGLERDHRPGDRAGRAVRARVRRAARQPLVRRRAGVADVLRARADRPAAAARRLPGDDAPGRARARSSCTRAPRCSTSWSTRRRRARDRRARPAHRRGAVALSAHAVVLATGGYSNVFFLSTNAQGVQRDRDLARAQARRGVREPVLHADPPDLHPAVGRHAVQADADERVAAQRRAHLGAARRSATTAPPDQIPEDERDYFLERRYPAFGNLVPRDVASRAAKGMIDEDRGVGPRRNGVYLDFADAIARLGEDVIRARYGNLFQMYERITGEDPYRVPMRIYPAPHYTMGGLWVDYDLMTTVAGPVRDRRGELLRPRREPARRQRADAGAGGRLLHPAGDDRRLPRAAARAGSTPDVGRRRVPRRRGGGAHARAPATSSASGEHSVDWFHRELGKIMWDACGMARNGAGLEHAMAEIAHAARALQGRRAGARRRRDAQPVAGEGRARRRLLRARPADVPRRAAPRGVLRRALPRGAPDARRRGAARRRQLLLRRGVGVHRAASRSCTARS